MGMGRGFLVAKQERAEATRDQIIRGASEVFDKHGYGSATLSDIIERSGVTKGALYFHFTSKEALAHAVVNAQHAISMDTGRLTAPVQGSVVEAMQRRCRIFAEQLRTDPVVRAGVRLTLEASIMATPVIAPYTDWMEEFESLIRQGIDNGEISDTIDPAAFAHYIVPSFTGVQMVSKILTGHEDVMERIDQMWSFLLPALVPSTGSPNTIRP